MDDPSSEEKFYWIGDGAGDISATPERAAGELTVVAIEPHVDPSGLVKISGKFEILLSPSCAENLLAQLGANNLLTRTAKMLYLLYAGNPQWIRDFRRRTRTIVREAKNLLG